MRIALLTYGTRGDVQPFVALAAGLQDAGHTVRLAAPQRFKELAHAYDIPFTPLAGDPAELSQALAEKAGANILRSVRSMIEHVVPLAGRVMDGLREACVEADVIVHSFLTASAGNTIAREKNLVDISAHLFPVFCRYRRLPQPRSSCAALGNSLQPADACLGQTDFLVWQPAGIAPGPGSPCEFAPANLLAS